MKQVIRIGSVALLLMCCLLPGLLTTTVSAANAEIAYPVTGGNIYFESLGYTSSGNAARVIRCDPEVTEATIPWEVEISGLHYYVSGIAASAFEDCDNLTSVTMEIRRNVAEYRIGTKAFFDCDNLVNVVLPDDYYDGQKYYGALAIETYAFADCDKLLDVVFPQNATFVRINDYAFQNCDSLASVTLPSSVSDNINGYPTKSVFSDCDSLTTVVCESSIGSRWFTDCNNLKSVTISGSVGEYAFANIDSLTDVTLLEGVRDIGSNAFYDCDSLAEISIPKSVNSIYPNAFAHCNQLSRVTISEGVSVIGEGAFSGCTALAAISIPSSVTSIGESAFSGCSGLTGSLTIPDSVTSIGYSAFFGCSGLTGSLTIPNSVTSIGQRAFSDCSGFTGSLTIPNSVTSIEYSAFEGCSGFTGSLTIPDSVTNIGGLAFQNCSSFTGSLMIPDSVTSIGRSAFEGCSGFTGSLTIPDSVTSMGDSAFSGCSGFTGSLTIPDSVTSIGNYVFEGCSGFTGSLTIPDSVTSVGLNAFSGCSGFTDSLTIPDSVTDIEDSAFRGCSGFTGSLMIPNSVTSIGYSAFKGCSGFTGSLTIPDGVTSIEGYAFYGCIGFTGSLTIPDSVTSIGSDAFSETSWKTVYYDGTQERLDALYRFPSSVTVICAKGTGTNGTTVEFHQKEYAVQYGQTVSLFLNITTAAGCAQTQLDSITWTSSNEAIFPANPNPVGETDSFGRWAFRGIVYDQAETTGDIFLTAKPKAVGSTTVKLTTADGASTYCVITVSGGSQSAVEMSGGEYKIKVGETGKIFADISNAQMLNSYTWQWTSSDESVVKIVNAAQGSYTCADGAAPDDRQTDSRDFRACSSGTAIITCTLSTGVSASRTITVLGEEAAADQSSIESNHYNCPKYKDPSQQQNEKNLAKYQEKFMDAFNEYMDTLEDEIQKLKEEECQESLSIEDQAEALRAADEKSSSRFLSADARMPDQYLDYAYQALSSCLLEGTQKTIDLSKIDLSKTYTVNSNIVNEIVKNVTRMKKTFSYKNATVDVSLGFNFGSAFGTMVVHEKGFGGSSYTITVCSTLDTTNRLVANYLNELKKLEASAIDNVYKAIFKDIFGKTLSDMTKGFLEKKFDASIKAFFTKHGLGEADKVIGHCNQFYENFKILRRTILTSDVTYLLDIDGYLSQYKITDEGISNKLAKQAAKKVMQAQKALIDALYACKTDGLVPAPEDLSLVKFWQWAKKTFKVQCPVSVEIYDSSGSQIGYAGQDDVWYEDSLYIDTDGEAKLIYVLTDQEISVKIVGTDYGSVSFTVEEWENGEPVYRTNYYDIGTENGSEILIGDQPFSTTGTSMPSVVVDGVRVYADEQISSDESACVTVTADSNDPTGGTVSGSGDYVRGDPIVFRAVPNERYVFAGWYDSDSQLVSVKSSYEFTAREPIHLTGVFVYRAPSLENYMVALTPDYQGKLEITVEQDGSAFSACIDKLDDALDLSKIQVYAARYDENGQMTSATALERQQSDARLLFNGVMDESVTKLFFLDARNGVIAQSLMSE